MERDSFEDFLYKKYIPSVSYISAFLALLIVLFMAGMSIYDKKLINRVSLRLQVGLAIYDIWLHTGSLWRQPFSKGPGPLCTFFGWNVIAFTLFDAFINVSIGMNLQLVFIHNMQITRKIEVAYWIVPILISLVITIPPLILGKFGWSKYAGCYITAIDEDFYMKLFDFFGTQLWRFLALIYLSIIVIIISIRLSRGVILIGSRRLNTNSESMYKTVSAVKLLGYRILLYPIFMVITRTGGILSQIYFDFNAESNVFLDRWTLLTYPLIGGLNFVAFCCDPTVHDATKALIYKNKVIKEHEKKDSNGQTGIELNVINLTLEENGNIANPGNNHDNDNVSNNTTKPL